MEVPKTKSSVITKLTINQTKKRLLKTNIFYNFADQPSQSIERKQLLKSG